MRTARLALPALLAALVACAEPDPPERVALEFWSSVAAHDRAAAARWAGDGDVAAALGDFAPLRSPAIGEALTSEDRALVETVFLVHGAPAPLSFSTHLQRSDGLWHIDLVATGEELSRARLAAARAPAAAEPAAP